jgi:hypothetical protein
MYITWGKLNERTNLTLYLQVIYCTLYIDCRSICRELEDFSVVDAIARYEISYIQISLIAQWAVGTFYDPDLPLYHH